MGGAAVRGPYGGAVARGPSGGVAARGPYGGAAYRGPYGGTAVRGAYGGGPPLLLVAFTGPATGLVPLRRGRSWGGCRCRCGFDLLSHTALLLSGTLL